MRHELARVTGLEAAPSTPLATQHDASLSAMGSRLNLSRSDATDAERALHFSRLARQMESELDQLRSEKDAEVARLDSFLVLAGQVG
jgi:hypothetical protein